MTYDFLVKTLLFQSLQKKGELNTIYLCRQNILPLVEHWE